MKKFSKKEIYQQYQTLLKLVIIDIEKEIANLDSEDIESFTPDKNLPNQLLRLIKIHAIADLKSQED